MKKYVLLSVVIIAMLASCKKDKNNEQQSLTSNTNDITAAITVTHATTIKGTAPASTGGTEIQLDTAKNNQVIEAYKGSYAIIHPTVSNGSVAGYYLTINGADSYFKIDFSPAASAVHAKKRHFFNNHPNNNGHTASRPAIDSSGYSDSVIIIKLPDNIAPGKYCITYRAYDWYGHISNTITTCVVVETLGDGSNGSEFNGTWKLSGYKFLDSTHNDKDTSWKYDVYDSIRHDQYYDTLYCLNDQLTGYCPSHTCDIISSFYSSYYWNNKADVTFSPNGAWLSESEDVNKYIDYQASTCSNPVYRKDIDNHTDIGGWSYNTATKKMIVIYTDSSTVIPSTEADEYQVTEKTATKFILQTHDENNRVDGYVEFSSIFQNPKIL
ncbi:MAG: hypothetical protein HY305_01115 [Sphingobacteriales bacterium]|nr:hypothetical protein [Sphingobacteriales bacterium]